VNSSAPEHESRSDSAVEASTTVPARCAQFESQVLPFLDMLHRAANQLAGNMADAEDLVQDTMLKAYSGFPSPRSDTHTTAPRPAYGCGRS
jgi:RNA polymerase sigma-70 factor (ECF subfamily)